MKKQIRQLTEKHLDLTAELTQTSQALAKALPQLRQTLDMSQFALAERLDVSQSEVGGIEAGYRQPTIKFVERLKRFVEAERYFDVAGQPDGDGLWAWTVWESYPADTGDETVVAEGREKSRSLASEMAAKYLI